MTNESKPRVLVLSGMCGAGKTHFAQKLKEEHGAVVVSADHHMVNSRGEYEFDALLLPECHDECFIRFMEAIDAEADLIVVDNTNSHTEEIAPYMQAASAFGYEATIIVFTGDPAQAHARSAFPGVSYSATERQHRRIMKMVSRFPRRWAHQLRPMEGVSRSGNSLPY